MVVQNFLRANRGWIWILLLGFLGGACAHSPQDELQRARTEFAALENSEAVLYIPDEIQQIRGMLQQAEKQLRANQFLLAERSIREGLARIRKAAQLYADRRDRAQQLSRDFVHQLARQLHDYRKSLGALPRLTYVDQNRFDVIRMRLQQLDRHYVRFEQCLESGRYLTIIKEMSRVRRQLSAVQHLIEQGRKPSRRVTRVEFDRESPDDDSELQEATPQFAAQR